MQQPTTHWTDDLFTFSNADDVSAIVNGLKGSLRVVSDVAHKRWMIQFPTDPGITEAETAQTALRTLLGKIVRDGGVKPSTWALIVKATKVQLPSVSGWLDFQPSNQKSYFALTSIRGREVMQWWGFCLAEIVMQQLDHRVRQCALESCENFFLDAKSRGPDRLFCSKSHGSQARVRRKRKRDARR